MLGSEKPDPHPTGKNVIEADRRAAGEEKDPFQEHGRALDGGEKTVLSLVIHVVGKVDHIIPAVFESGLRINRDPLRPTEPVPKAIVENRDGLPGETGPFG